MKNVLAIASRIINQVRMDPRTVGLILVAPILMLAILWLVLNSGVTRPIVATLGGDEALIVELKKDADVQPVADAEAGRALVKSRAADGFIDLSGDSPKILVDGADPSLTGLVTKTLQKASLGVLAAAPMLSAISSRIQPELELLYGSKEQKMFDFTSPVLMGFVIFFFIFILSGISFLRERLDGTLDRILVSPATRMQVVFGYMLGFGSFALIQTVLIQSFMIYVLKAPSLGNFFEILAVNVLLGLTGLSLGSLISAFAANEFQVFQFIPLIIVPQILFAGIFNLREAPHWVQALGWIFPLSYGGDALRAVMVRGSGLVSVLPQLGALAGFIALFLMLSGLALKKRRS